MSPYQHLMLATVALAALTPNCFAQDRAEIDRTRITGNRELPTRKQSQYFEMYGSRAIFSGSSALSSIALMFELMMSDSREKTPISEPFVVSSRGWCSCFSSVCR